MGRFVSGSRQNESTFLGYDLSDAPHEGRACKRTGPPAAPASPCSRDRAFLFPSLTALRAGPPFLLGWYTSGGPPGGRSLSKDRDVRTYAKKKSVGSPLPPYTEIVVSVYGSVGWRALAWKKSRQTRLAKRRRMKLAMYLLSCALLWSQSDFFKVHDSPGQSTERKNLHRIVAKVSQTPPASSKGAKVTPGGSRTADGNGQTTEVRT